MVVIKVDQENQDHARPFYVWLHECPSMALLKRFGKGLCMLVIAVHKQFDLFAGGAVLIILGSIILSLHSLMGSAHQQGGIKGSCHWPR